MPSLVVAEFQNDLQGALQQRFLPTDVRKEWASIPGSVGVYSPRLDLAVGPFATGELRYGPTYDTLFERNRGFVTALWTAHRSNVGDGEIGGQTLEGLRTANRNARCFLAIEIENQVTRKHLMGGAINAAALGRLGIAVGWDQRRLMALLRLRRYLNFLAGVDKPTFSVNNLLILSPEQLSAAVSRS